MFYEKIITSCVVAYILQPIERPADGILDIKRAIALEVCIVSFLLYFCNKYIRKQATEIGIIFGIMLFEHAKQFLQSYRTQGGSVRDYCTLCLHLTGLVCAIRNRHWDAAFGFSFGVCVHCCSCITCKSDSCVLSYRTMIDWWHTKDCLVV